ncbi:MAG: nicotinamide mononucleotide transporter [Rhodospirillaceae bacterium]|nr:nicotinamide mononucleotide transporter [Rhodospirillaceae bacterium]
MATFPPVELVAAVFTLACVWLTIRQNLWCWPTGLVGAGVYAVVFFQARLLSDAALQVVFIVLQVYGWHHWLYGGKDGRNTLPVSDIAPKEAALWAAVIAAGTVLVGRLTTEMGAALPYWDAFTTVVSLVAQYLMARKVVQSFLLWMTVDVVAVGIYATKALYLTAGLYAVFLCLATLGYLNWRRARRLQDRLAVA